MRVLLALLLSCVAFNAVAHSAATLVVAAADAAPASKASADYVADGEGDQEEINAAIRALPAVGGTVQLTEGTFDIRRVKDALGGILIERSNVVLAGRGTSTKLIQAPEQETNVIRIIGLGVGYVTIRDLYVDANRDANPLGEGDPNVSHARFEFCGIKAFRSVPGGSSGADTHHITIRNCHVVNARRLGIMLEGPNMHVVDNVLGNANSDVVEILTGPGEMRGNYAEITGRTHVAFGSDRGSNIIMSGNTVHVRKGGDIDIGFRSWANSKHHTINGNVIRVEAGGKMGRAMDIRGTETTVTGNSLFNHADNPILPLYIRGGNTVLTGNVFENMTLIVDDETESQKPILIRDNIMENTTIDHRRGNLNSEKRSTQ
ncbi:MAG: right-handed parallel beta-helix repeat-containing protein [Candidatus Hydrogenedentes bacterium]|nr:right-handed parallel beta-helix repeat-containing protein [Candidatus Hydrogenedentota bacterium]